MGTFPSTQNTFSVLLDSVCAVTAMITKCDKSQNATARIPELSQFVTVAFCDSSNCTSQIHVRSARGYTPQYRKHIHIDVGHYQQGFLCKSIMGFITDIYIHTNRYNSEIMPKWAKMKLFIFMSKVNMGILPSTQNTFSVLLDSVCAVTAMITKCDKSQNATARIPELSQFVTVAFSDGSKCNFSDSCP